MDIKCIDVSEGFAVTEGAAFLPQQKLLSELFGSSMNYTLQFKDEVKVFLEQVTPWFPAKKLCSKVSYLHVVFQLSTVRLYSRAFNSNHSPVSGSI